MNWHQLDIADVYKATESTPTGISAELAARKIRIFGPNQLPTKGKKPAWLLFLLGFKDFMILVLLLAAVVAGLSGEVMDMVVILSIVTLNAVIGFIQQYNAGKAMDALKRMDIIKATVMRDGKACNVSSVELVPGDLVMLETGNMVPADLRLVAANALQIGEAALTGESLPAEKDAGRNLSNEVALGDRFNMAYKDTIVVNGSGAGIVVGTGKNTELGRISGLMSAEEPPTPLQVKMAYFTKRLSYLLLAICGILFCIGVLHGEPLMNMLLLSISLAVAAIPEALPALITISLALGAKKMVRKNILLRTLAAVETLGSVSVICTDKTGTITGNKMKVADVRRHSRSPALIEGFPLMRLLMLLNHSLIRGSDAWQGDPMELALVEYAEQDASISPTVMTDSFPKTAELPFDPIRRCMTTVHRLGKQYLLITKGAPEAIESLSSSIHDAREIIAEGAKMASEGMRVIAYAYTLLDIMPSQLENELERNLQFAGYVGLTDPPRPQIAGFIKKCRSAGVRVIMLTGDHVETAVSIAKQAGIMTRSDAVLSGTDLNMLTKKELEDKVERIEVCARMSPQQKLDVIQALQRRDHYVAMTGDGFNDAPALKLANLGIAMGISGTDISKEAAKMVLLDDNFGSILKGIQEGRRIYDNIRKFVKYILTCNTAEIAIIFIAPLIGLPVPLLPIQILWINLVTDGLPGLALSSEQEEKNIMHRQPRKVNESLFAGGIGFHIIWAAAFLTLLVLALQAFAIHVHSLHWQTMVFTALSLSQLAHVLAIRSEDQFIFAKGILSNPFLASVLAATFLLQMAVVYLPAGNKVFNTQALTATELMLSMGVAIVFFHSVELEKWVKTLMKRRGLGHASRIVQADGSTQKLLANCKKR